MSRPRKTSDRARFEDPETPLYARQAIDNRIVHQVPIAKIRASPQNPRQRLGRIDELAAGLVDHQRLQPVVARRARRGYELIAGHHRLEAAKTLGWMEIPAVLQDEMNAQAYVQTLVETLQREDLTTTEEASVFRVLVRERGWTTHQVGAAIRRSHIFVSRRLRVFEDPVLAPLIVQAGLPVTTVEELLRATDPEMRQRLAREAARGNWTPAEARQAVARAKQNDLPQDESLERDLERVRKVVLHLDPERMASSTTAEAQRLLSSLAAPGQAEERRTAWGLTLLVWFAYLAPPTLTPGRAEGPQKGIYGGGLSVVVEGSARDHEQCLA